MRSPNQVVNILYSVISQDLKTRNSSSPRVEQTTIHWPSMAQLSLAMIGPGEEIQILRDGPSSQTFVLERRNHFKVASARRCCWRSSKLAPSLSPIGLGFVFIFIFQHCLPCALVNIAQKYLHVNCELPYRVGFAFRAAIGQMPEVQQQTGRN